MQPFVGPGKTGIAIPKKNSSISAERDSHGCRNYVRKM